MSLFQQRNRFVNFALSNIANLVTILSLLCGLYVIINIEFISSKLSIMLILFAAALDGLDGRIARFVRDKYKIDNNNTGVQLDSFCDLINFGIAPVLIYRKEFFYNIETMHFFAMALYVSASVFRLTRFNNQNIITFDNLKKLNFNFSIGLTMPIAGLFILLPICINYTFPLYNIHCRDCLSSYTFCVSFLMISKLHFPIIKKIKFSNISKLRKIAIALTATFLFITTFVNPYATLILILAIYITVSLVFLAVNYKLYIL
jgi:CDP-diacylglycerol--serine O-phosphatidyltransferase